MKPPPGTASAADGREQPRRGPGKRDKGPGVGIGAAAGHGSDPGIDAESGVDDPGMAPSIALRFSSWSIGAASVLIVSAGIVVLNVLGGASTMLWWLAIGTVIAAVAQPAVLWLRRFVPGWIAITVVIVVSLGLVGGVGYRGVTELTEQFDILQAKAVDAARNIEASTQLGQVATEFRLVAKINNFFDSLPVALGGSEDAAATVQSAASSGSALFAIAMFALLMLIFGPRFVSAGLYQIGDDGVRGRFSALVVNSYRESYRYAWLMAFRAIVLGTIGGLICWAVGFETPTALGVAFAALSMIPGLGIIIAAIPVAIFVGIGSFSGGLAVITTAVIIQAVEVALVQRRIEGVSVHVGPAPTLVAALIGMQLYGLGGSLVGLAVAVFVLAMLRRLTHTHDEVFTAVRELVGEDQLGGDIGPTLIGGEGVEVIVAPGSNVVIESAADVAVAEPTDEGAPPTGDDPHTSP